MDDKYQRGSLLNDSVAHTRMVSFSESVKDEPE